MLPVVGPDNSLLGVVVLDELHLAVKAESAGSWLLAADLMRSDVRPLHPDDRLDLGMQLFAETDLLVLPVVDGSPQNRVIGLVRRVGSLQGVPEQASGEPRAGRGPGDGRDSRHGNP